MLDSHIVGYLERIGRSADMDDVADALTREAVELDLTAVTCRMLTGPKAASADPFYVNTWPRPWLEIYERRGFDHKDPANRWAISSGAPTSWNALMRRIPPNDPAHEVQAAARSFGFREGFVAPVRTSAGHLGLVSLFGDRRPLTSGEVIFLQAICPGTLQRMEALDQAPEPARPVTPLSQRERECAALLAQGLSNPAIADCLGISNATVKFHIANACSKLGARSRTQLVALLPALGHRGPGDGTGAGAAERASPRLMATAHGVRQRRPGMTVLQSIEGKFYEMTDEQARAFEIPRDEVRDLLTRSGKMRKGRAAAKPAGAAPAPVVVQIFPGSSASAGTPSADDVTPYWDRQRGGHPRGIPDGWAGR